MENKYRLDSKISLVWLFASNKVNKGLREGWAKHYRFDPVDEALREFVGYFQKNTLREICVTAIIAVISAFALCIMVELNPGIFTPEGLKILSWAKGLMGTIMVLSGFATIVNCISCLKGLKEMTQSMGEESRFLKDVAEFAAFINQQVNELKDCPKDALAVYARVRLKNAAIRQRRAEAAFQKAAKDDSSKNLGECGAEEAAAKKAFSDACGLVRKFQLFEVYHGQILADVTEDEIIGPLTPMQSCRHG